MTPPKLVEEAVLGGAMLWEGPWPPEVLELEPEYFTDQTRAQIWEAAQALIRAHAKVDEVTLTAQLSKWDVHGCAAYLHDLAESAPSSSALVDWSRVLVEGALKRQARAAVKEALNRCDGSTSPDDIAAMVNDAVRNVRGRSEERGPRHISSGVRSTIKELEQEHKDPGAARIVTTGIGALDDAVELRKGDLTVIAGRPSMGKSALAGNITQRCGRNQHKGIVALFSLEMSLASLIRRMLASEAQVPTRALPAKAAAGELVTAAADIHSLNCYVDDRPALSIGAVHGALSRINQRVRLVIFDYLQLAKFDEGEKMHSVRVGNMTKGLKALAKEFGCHTIALSQLNRSVESRKPPRPQLSDLRDSGEIEAHADNVLGLYRPSYYDTTAESDLAEVLVLKQRNGETGIVEVKWNGPTQTFSDLAR